MKDLENVTSENLEGFNEYLDDIGHNKTLAVYKLMESLFNITKESESISENEIDVNN